MSGNTPGWPTTDLIVINDNNKAQRNMSVHYGLSGFGSTHYAIIRNASKEPRDFVLMLNAGSETIRGFTRPRVQAEHAGDPMAFKPGATLVVSGMSAGESRWVAFEMTAFKGKTGKSLPVDLFEVVDGKVVNGFRFNLTAATRPQALRAVVLLNAAVFQRLESQFRLAAAGEIVKASRRLLKTPSITTSVYRKFLGTIKDQIEACVERFLAAGDDRSLGIGESLALVLRSLEGRASGKTFATHVTLLNKLDVAATLLRPVGRRRRHRK